MCENGKKHVKAVKNMRKRAQMRKSISKHATVFQIARQWSKMRDSDEKHTTEIKTRDSGKTHNSIKKCATKKRKSGKKCTKAVKKQ